MILFTILQAFYYSVLCSTNDFKGTFVYYSRELSIGAIEFHYKINLLKNLNKQKPNIYSECPCENQHYKQIECENEAKEFFKKSYSFLDNYHSEIGKRGKYFYVAHFQGKKLMGYERISSSMGRNSTYRSVKFEDLKTVPFSLWLPFLDFHSYKRNINAIKDVK